MLRRYPLAVLLIIIGLFYLGNYNGLWTSNDGSQFALVRSICLDHRFEIGPQNLPYTLGVDYAVSRHLDLNIPHAPDIDYFIIPLSDPDDPSTPPLRIYSDRPPGTALLIAPFFAVGSAIAQFDDFDFENTTRLWACIGVMWFALLNVALIYWAARLLRASQSAALMAAGVFALAGLAFKYSTLLFSHTPSLTTTLLGVCLLLRALPQRRAKAYVFAAGFVMAYAVAIEYQNAIFSAIFLITWLIWLRRENKTELIIPLLLGGILPAAGLASYHYACFGHVLISTHAYNPTMPHNQHLGSIFSGNWGSGLYDIFLRWQMGLLVTAPVFVLGLAGLWMARRQVRMAYLPLVSSVVYTIVISRHATIVGGSTYDCRYLIPAVSLLAIGLAPLIDGIYSMHTANARRAVAAFFAAIALYSVAASLYFTIDRKMSLEHPLPKWHQLLFKYATLPNPDDNLDRLIRNVYLLRYKSMNPDFVIVPVPGKDDVSIERKH